MRIPSALQVCSRPAFYISLDKIFHKRSRVWTKYFKKLCIIISFICVIFLMNLDDLFYCGLHDFLRNLWFLPDMFPSFYLHSLCSASFVASSATVIFSHTTPATSSSSSQPNNIFLSHHSSSSLPNAVNRSLDFFYHKFGHSSCSKICAKYQLFLLWLTLSI